jgi:TonB-linked SusC/RagA family outer membrane protein
MMMKRVLTVLVGTALVATQAAAQEKVVTGRVTNELGSPLPGVSIDIRGTATATQSSLDGNYTIRASSGQVLQFRRIGYTPQSRTVGAENVVNVALSRNATDLNTVVISALGQTTTQRSLGTSQQTVQGADIAETGRENFINSLQGRVAGVEVNSSSGVPGASASITIRGVSSISSSNQPLMIIDGLPMDNKTLNTNVLASDAPGSLTALNNRGVDFTNRAADINPEDIESMVVLKGPEAAALYGIDAANGAIVITTKRGRAGMGGLEYSNDFQINNTRARPELQRTFGPTSFTVEGQQTSFAYFGNPYPANTQFYDNIDGFFRQAVSQRHNLTFSGASADSRLDYRLGVGYQNVQGVVLGSDYGRINLTGRTGAQVTSWLKADLSMQYAETDNNQPYKGAVGPLIGLLLWPATDDAKDYLTPAGTRRRLTTLSAVAEVDNPYFNLARNSNNSTNSRLIANLGLVITPFSWGSFSTNIGSDGYTNENQILRDPQSAAGNTFNGVLDVAADVTRSINVRNLFNVNRIALGEKFAIEGLIGNQINDARSQVNALQGQNFLDPNFVSINNTNLRTNRTTLAQRRLVGVYASATASYDDYLFVTVQGRNDWTSTIPTERNSFFYPGVSASLVLSDAVPAIGRVMTAKLRGGYAEVGKDAKPYAYRPSLEYKTTSFGGYGYGFTGPNLSLKPEFARSYEFGTELGFFDNRVGLDVTTYRKQTRDQIVNDIRGSYATGFVLFNLNGAITRNEGIEATLRLNPVRTANFTWDVFTNFDRSRGRTLALPNALPESYVSDTWLFGDIRNGTQPGLSTRSLTGRFYLRDTIPGSRKILIDPTTGLPLRATTFIDAGYDRQPDFSVGITNTLRYKRLSLNFLLDIRKGGDIFNATEQYLTSRGLSTRTLDRDQPRVIEGVLRDGKENTANPTINSIVVVPAVQIGYYTAISEELFIEKDINWVRLRDVTLRMNLPGRALMARDASIWVRGTDLFLFTNYSGLDPVVNGNTAAVGGSGASGIDFGSFPMPRGLAFGVKVGY